MTRHVGVWIASAAAVSLVMGAFGLAQQGAPLPIGKMESGTATAEKPAIYDYRASSAGVLSVAVQGDGDLALVVTDQDGQSIAEGASDRDLYGSPGSEQILVSITEPGTYRVHVRLLDGAGKFQIGAAWIPFPPRARPPDPDKRPATARPIDAGKPYEDSLDSGAGDSWDWFVFTPKTDGTLTVIVRQLGGQENSMDLVLEVYTTSDFTKPTVRSDQDMQGNPANESATVDVTAGQKVYVRVAGASDSVAGKYRLSSSLIQ